MLLRLAYLTIINAFAALRLLPMSDRDVCQQPIGEEPRATSSNQRVSSPVP